MEYIDYLINGALTVSTILGVALIIGGFIYTLILAEESENHKAFGAACVAFFGIMLLVYSGATIAFRMTENLY